MRFFSKNKMTAEILDAIPSGNTTPSVMPNFRGRAFLFTIFEEDKFSKLCDIMDSLKSCDYQIAAQEVAPTTNNLHIHYYCHFTQSYRLSQKILKLNIHIDICKGTPKQNIDYVTKDGNILFEKGERPHQGIKTVQEIHELQITECPAQLYKIKKSIDEEMKSEESFFKMLDEIRNNELKAPEIIYIVGDSGSGKTYHAYSEATKEYKNNEIGKLTIENNFVDITNSNAKCFVIEEFRDSQMKASSFLQLTDKYGYKCNVKGGFTFIRPEKIYICSIIEPENIYHDEINKQFLRRITDIHRMENHVCINKVEF